MWLLRMGEKPPEFMVAQRDAAISGKTLTLSVLSSSCRRLSQLRSGRSFTSSAKEVKMQRVRNSATSLAGYLSSRLRASVASLAATSRVTLAV